MKNNIALTIEEVTNEIGRVLKNVDTEDINKLINEVKNADKVYFVGVGRVKLSLEAIAKRLSHLGIDTYVVGQITEPAITDKDLLIVGSGSGESLIPVSIVKKAKSFNARVAHIGANENCTISNYSDVFVKLPTSTKLNKSDEVKSIQPMTSLFEQTLLILGDIVALEIIKTEEIEMENLWQYHANLE